MAAADPKIKKKAIREADEAQEAVGVIQQALYPPITTMILDG